MGLPCLARPIVRRESVPVGERFLTNTAASAGRKRCCRAPVDDGCGVDSPVPVGGFAGNPSRGDGRVSGRPAATMPMARQLHVRGTAERTIRRSRRATATGFAAEHGRLRRCGDASGSSAPRRNATAGGQVPPNGGCRRSAGADARTGRRRHARRLSCIDQGRRPPHLAQQRRRQSRDGPGLGRAGGCRSPKTRDRRSVESRPGADGCCTHRQCHRSDRYVSHGSADHSYCRRVESDDQRARGWRRLRRLPLRCVALWRLEDRPVQPTGGGASGRRPRRGASMID